MATSGSNVPQLNSIDDLVQLTLASSSDESTGNARSARALAPALKRLDKSGTPAGVSALQICTSALKDGSDALDALIPQSWTPTQPRPGLAAAYVLYVLRRHMRCCNAKVVKSTAHRDSNSKKQSCQLSTTKQLPFVNPMTPTN